MIVDLSKHELLKEISTCEKLEGVEDSEIEKFLYDQTRNKESKFLNHAFLEEIIYKGQTYSIDIIAIINKIYQSYLINVNENSKLSTSFSLDQANSQLKTEIFFLQKKQGNYQLNTSISTEEISNLTSYFIFSEISNFSDTLRQVIYLSLINLLLKQSHPVEIILGLLKRIIFNSLYRDSNKNHIACSQHRRENKNFKIFLSILLISSKNHNFFKTENNKNSAKTENAWSSVEVFKCIHSVFDEKSKSFKDKVNNIDSNGINNDKTCLKEWQALKINLKELFKLAEGFIKLGTGALLKSMEDSYALLEDYMREVSFPVVRELSECFVLVVNYMLGTYVKVTTSRTEKNSGDECKDNLKRIFYQVSFFEAQFSEFLKFSKNKITTNYFVDGLFLEGFIVKLSKVKVRHDFSRTTLVERVRIFKGISCLIEKTSPELFLSVYTQLCDSIQGNERAFVFKLATEYLIDNPIKDLFIKFFNWFNIYSVKSKISLEKLSFFKSDAEFSETIRNLQGEPLFRRFEDMKDFLVLKKQINEIVAIFFFEAEFIQNKKAFNAYNVFLNENWVSLNKKGFIADIFNFFLFLGHIINGYVYASIEKSNGELFSFLSEKLKKGDMLIKKSKGTKKPIKKFNKTIFSDLLEMSGLIYSLCINIKGIIFLTFNFQNIKNATLMNNPLGTNSSKRIFFTKSLNNEELSINRFFNIDFFSPVKTGTFTLFKPEKCSKNKIDIKVSNLKILSSSLGITKYLEMGDSSKEIKMTENTSYSLSNNLSVCPFSSSLKIKEPGKEVGNFITVSGFQLRLLKEITTLGNKVKTERGAFFRVPISSVNILPTSWMDVFIGVSIDIGLISREGDELIFDFDTFNLKKDYDILEKLHTNFIDFHNELHSLLPTERSFLRYYLDCFSKKGRSITVQELIEENGILMESGDIYKILSRLNKFCF